MSSFWTGVRAVGVGAGIGLCVFQGARWYKNRIIAAVGQENVPYYMVAQELVVGNVALGVIGGLRRRAYTRAGGRMPLKEWMKASFPAKP